MAVPSARARYGYQPSTASKDVEKKKEERRDESRRHGRDRKRRRSFSSSSSSSSDSSDSSDSSGSSCSTCSTYASRSLISCSTCSGYYTRSSSSSSRSSSSPRTRNRAGLTIRRTSTQIRDPRQHGKRFTSPELGEVLFEADANWVYPAERLPTFFLLEGISATSKAQLFGQLEGAIGNGPAGMILDIELFQKALIASVAFKSGSSCYQCLLESRAKFEGLGWRASLDGGQKAFRRRIALSEQLALRKDLERVGRDVRRDSNRGREYEYACDRRVSCLLVDYEFFSSRESSRDLYRIFERFPVRNVERHSSCWHVHLEGEEAVEAAYAQRSSFLHEGLRIRPYLDRPPPPVRERVKQNVPLEDPLESIRSLFTTTASSSKAMLPIKILEPVQPASAVDASLINLPVFNRKYLERLQELAQEQEEDEEVFEEILEDVIPEEAVEEPFPENAEEVEELIEPSEPTPLPIEEPELELKSGCARLEGYFKQKNKTKVWFEPIIQTATATDRQRSARTGRSRADLADQLAGKLSALHLRQKLVILGRSSIHSYGLFAGEDMAPGDLVIEYVGEVIRHSLANIRELRLEEQLRAAGSSEMASSYFFRLDLTYVVDATHTGNLARFVNHCCDPNCIAKVVQLEGKRQHIVFYARRPITRGDEITYDYKFAIEDNPGKKIRCLCGSPACRKYLN